MRAAILVQLDLRLMFRSRKLHGLVSSRRVPQATLCNSSHHCTPGIAAVVYRGISTTVSEGDAPAFPSAGGKLLGKPWALSLCRDHPFLTLRLSSPGVVPHHEDADVLSWDAGTNGEMKHLLTCPKAPVPQDGLC